MIQFAKILLRSKGATYAWAEPTLYRFGVNTTGQSKDCRARSVGGTCAVGTRFHLDGASSTWKFFWKQRERERAKEHRIEMKDINRFQMILALYIVLITCIDAWKLDLYKNSIIEFFATKISLFRGVMNEVRYWSVYLMNMISKGNVNRVITSIAGTVAGLIVAALAIVAVWGIIYFIYRNIIRNMDYRIGLVTIVTLSLPVYVTSMINYIFHPGYAVVNPFMISLYLFATVTSVVLYIERSWAGEMFDYKIRIIKWVTCGIAILWILYFIFLRGWGMFAIVFLLCGKKDMIRNI